MDNLPSVLMHFKGLSGMSQKLVAPLVVLGLADLVFATDFSHRLTLQTLEHNTGFGLGLPFPSVHG